MASITWVSGGEADVEQADAERMVVVSTRSSAPGSRLDGHLLVEHAVRLKVHRCQRVGSEEPARFRIEGRLIDATRAVRAALASLGAAPPSP